MINARLSQLNERLSPPVPGAPISESARSNTSTRAQNRSSALRHPHPVGGSATFLQLNFTSKFCLLETE